MPKAKQLTVSCDDQPGTLSHISRILGDASVNILAFHCGTEGHQGVVRVVVDNANKARKALTAAELPFTESDVLLQELPHTPGALGFFAGKLAHKDVDIQCAWAATAPTAKKGMVVFCVSDVESAARVR